MSILLTSVVRLRGQPLVRQLDAAAEAPQAAQQAFLLRLLNKNADTIFGREHRFHAIKTEQDYRQLVPIRDYEEFRPYVNRLICGEKSVLTAEQPFMFTMTSGTTGEPKYIPVTRESEEQGNCLMRQWLYRTLRDHPQSLSHATVGVVSPEIEGYTTSGIPYGSLSGRIYQQIPAIVRRSYAVPYPVFELKNYDERYKAIARFSIAKRISLISTPNPSTLIRLAEVATTHKEILIRSIYDGNLGFESAAQPELVAKIEQFLKPQPRRARELEKIAEATDSLLPKYCWSHLKVLGCWTGGSVGVQAQKLADYFGNLPIRDLGYLASEGRMSLPEQDNTSLGILALSTNYYEFIPEEELESAEPPILLSHELELGKRYIILLTTAAGLYRYNINDIVEVTGFYKKAPLLAFLRKGKDMTNITGEKMHVNHILMVMEQVKRQFHLPVVLYRMTPNLEHLRYDLYLELSNGTWSIGHEPWLQQRLIPVIEQALCEINIEYAQKRRSKRLRCLCLHLMHPGWFEAESRREAANSKRDVQYKWKILCHQPSPEDQEAIITTIEGDDATNG